MQLMQVESMAWVEKRPMARLSRTRFMNRSGIQMPLPKSCSQGSSSATRAFQKLADANMPRFKPRAIQSPGFGRFFAGVHSDMLQIVPAAAPKNCDQPRLGNAGTRENRSRRNKSKSRERLIKLQRPACFWRAPRSTPIPLPGASKILRRLNPSPVNAQQVIIV